MKNEDGKKTTKKSAPFFSRLENPTNMFISLQKHKTGSFSHTFFMMLTPRSNATHSFRGLPALRKSVVWLTMNLSGETQKSLVACVGDNTKRAKAVRGMPAQFSPYLDCNVFFF